jgi:hypothetical protein
MSQYHPTPYINDNANLKRTLYKEEYEAAVNAMVGLGFRNGWIQDMDSYRSYKPDFRRKHPFEG